MPGLLPRAALALITLAGVAFASADAPSIDVTTTPAFGGAVFERPVDLAHLPAGGWLLADQGGRVFELGADGSSHEVLDLTATVSLDHQEEGLLSLALDPGFPGNHHFWVYYTSAGPLRSVVARFTLKPSPAETRASALVVLEVPQPYQNHNGGAIRFGPDGMLYLGLGDGGDAWDPHGTGQDRSDLLGSIIRIDVRASSLAQPYRVPPDNPFVRDRSARPEIWAYGLRNPWRMAFDPATGDLWAGDVGQHEVEEVDRVLPGRNYGWDLIEGDHCLAGGCDALDIEAPLLTYDHAGSNCAITGGVTYRGKAIPGLSGQYLFADLCSALVWAVETRSGRARVLMQVDGAIVSFATAADGEVYILQVGGSILQLRPA